MVDVRNTCLFIGSLVAADRYGRFLLPAYAVKRVGVSWAVSLEPSP